MTLSGSATDKTSLQGTPQPQLSTSLNGPGNVFLTAVPNGTGGTSSALAIADFNGDGKLDLASANTGNNTVTVLLGNGDGTFKAPISTAVSCNPVWVAAGDFNGDGKMDLAVAATGCGPGTNGVTILLGNGDGTFTTKGTLTSPLSNPESIVVGDFNGDGNMDLAVVDRGASTDSVFVYLGNGDGTFQSPTSVNLGGLSASNQIVAADFNKDGHLDLAVSEINGSNILVLLGNGNGTFQAPRAIALPGQGWGVAVGDVNGDGIPDLVATSPAIGGVSVFLGKGDGSFTPVNNPTTGTLPTAYAAVADGGCTAIAVGDFNKDGKLDVITGLSGVNGAASVSVLLGNGDGTLQSQALYGTVDNPSFVGVADFNGDGNLDWVTNGNVSIYAAIGLGRGDGTFLAANNFALGIGPSDADVADFNNDGKLDVVVPNSGSQTVSILLGKGDGTFLPRVDIPFPALSPWAVATGDFNNDGNPDFVVFSQWCPSGVNAPLYTYLGKGDGTFQSPVTTTLSGLSSCAAVNNMVTGDFNHDGKLDVAIAYNHDTGNPLIQILLGNGDGTFTPMTAFSTGGTSEAQLTTAALRTTGPMSGTLDLVLTDFRAGLVKVFLGNGDGTFQAPVNIATGRFPGGVVIADFNGDGKPDILLDNQLDNNAEIFLGNGDGTFNSGTLINTGTGAPPANIIVVGDFNLDGKLDIAFDHAGNARNLVNGVSYGMSLMLGNGDGTFQAPQNYLVSRVATPVPNHSGSILTTDYNRDGAPDVLLLDPENYLTVLLNQTPPPIAVSPSSLSFGNQVVGTTSSALTVKVSNNGNTATTIGVSANGDFAQTNNCPVSPATLAPAASCTISVTFAPTATGVRSGAVVVTDTLPGSPQMVTLSGTGTAPVVTLGATSVSFGNQVVGTSSSQQNVSLQNTGTATLTFTGSGITITGTNSGDYSQTNTCGASLAAGANCSISITFKPTATGTRSASLTINDDASNSPQNVPLSGTGVTPVAGVSPASLAFTSQPVGTTSAAQNVTLSNTGNATLTFTGSGISISGTNSGDFAQTNTCGTSVAAGANCAISVTFKPTATGTRTASVTITDDASTSPQTVSLTGTGAAAAPVASLSVTTLSFGNQLVGTSSSAQNETLTNTGNATLTFSGSGITITGTNSGDFSQTNTCGASVAAGSNCTISVTFKPTASGSRAASLSITDNAADSPQTVSLTGTGTAPTVSFGGTTSLTFSNQLVGTSSPAQTVTLTNTGTATLTFSGSGIAIAGANSGDFAETNTCGASVAAGANCTISVTFKPTATGARNASLSVTDNASGSPQTISMTGTGVAPAVTLSATSLTFAGQLITTTSAAQTITLTNSGTAPLTISSIVISGTNSGDFAQTSTCPASTASLAAGAKCTISVTFTPAATGARTAAVTITDSASGSPHTVSLTGTGTDYSLAAATGSNCPAGGNCSTTATIASGQTATYDLQVTPSSGFNGTVALTCMGAPGSSTCSIMPSSVPPNGSSSYAFVVTVGNTSNVMLMPQVRLPRTRALPMAYPALAMLFILLSAMLFMKSIVSAGKQLRPILLPAFCVLLLVVMCSSGCGGGGGGPTPPPPTNATLTITGASGGINRTLSLKLTVTH
jgi:hypothetical protein